MECEDPPSKTVEEKTTCEICGKKFDSNHALVSHKSTPKSHDFCEICGERFPEVRDPKVEKSIHKNKKHPEGVKCGVCYLEFHDQESFNEHRRLKHPQEYMCDICGEKCKSDLSIYHHKRIYHDIKDKKLLKKGEKKGGEGRNYNFQPPKSKYSEELEHRVRSGWEEKIGRILSEGNIHYKYESIKFKLEYEEEIHAYTPDFMIGDIVVEPHGRFYEGDEEKFRKFTNQFSMYTLILVGQRNQCSEPDEICDLFVPWKDRENLVDIIKKER